jgi:hypothetical protein
MNIIKKEKKRKTLHKSRAGGLAQGEDTEFEPQYHKQTHTKEKIKKKYK